MNKALNTRIKVKPVGYTRFVGDFFEGPCRTGDEKELSQEGEISGGKKLFSSFLEHLKPNLNQDVELLKPVFLSWNKKYNIPEKELRKLDEDSEEADLFLLSIGWGGDICAEIARRYKKPIAFMWSAPLRSTKATPPFPARFTSTLDFEDLNRTITSLRVKKSVQQSRILAVVVDKGKQTLLENIKSQFGIDYKCISVSEIFREMDRVIECKSEQKTVEETTTMLIKNAQKVHMKKEYIHQSVNFYQATKNLMVEYGCNAFSLPCYEICERKIPHKKKVGFCLTHSLLKDEGYPSVCEGDLYMLPAMMLLMYISRRSTPMGNPWVENRENNLYSLQHDVPGLKMKGFDKPCLPYEIMNFTFGGWGATIRHDFSLDKGEVVNISTFDSTFKNMLLVKGEITGCSGFREIGCLLKVIIKVPDVYSFYRKAMRFNHHHVMVYGDYTQELISLGEIMGFKVEI